MYVIFILFLLHRLCRFALELSSTMPFHNDSGWVTVTVAGVIIARGLDVQQILTKGKQAGQGSASGLLAILCFSLPYSTNVSKYMGVEGHLRGQKRKKWNAFVYFA